MLMSLPSLTGHIQISLWKNEGRRDIHRPSKDILFQQEGTLGNFHDGIVAFLDNPQDRSYGGKNVMSEKFRRRYFTSVVRIFKMFLADFIDFLLSDEGVFQQQLGAVNMASCLEDAGGKETDHPELALAQVSDHRCLNFLVLVQCLGKQGNLRA